jgi:hypothetical protein
VSPSPFDLPVRPFQVGGALTWGLAYQDRNRAQGSTRHKERGAPTGRILPIVFALPRTAFNPAHDFVDAIFSTDENERGVIGILGMKDKATAMLRSAHLHPTKNV